MIPPGVTFINADEIAKTLPNYPSRNADIDAGRLALERMEEMEQQRADFAVETTLASRSLAPRIARLRRDGYHFRLIFVWTPDADFSIQRVAARVRAGGHDIPEETIRRRHAAGIRNFFELYQPLADKWGVYDATTESVPPPRIAKGIMGRVVQVDAPDSWDLMRKGTRDV